ncbi:hypothetical protein PC9H_011822 [Pleurotus ostreatus]|uniref:Uncharacterized protein n=1 Tax=Pleurotus ostreatus TaxID=5322 RepID=A0A8H7DLU4_PLEOS|nr:uncharacterized protein PC9H_011822 [Pleurotus ostreatus]KAF7421300.1 hypothetical protein PC9H_011822 [Pleurotus ostreatus]
MATTVPPTTPLPSDPTSPTTSAPVSPSLTPSSDPVSDTTPPVTSPPVTSPPVTSPPTSPPVTSPPSSPPVTSPPTSDPPTSPPVSNPPTTDGGSVPPTTDSTTPTPTSDTASATPSVISTPVTTVIQTSVVQTSADGQIFTTVIQTSSVLPPGSTITAAPNTNNTSSSSSNTGAIVGGVVGGIAGLALIVGALVWWRRRQNRFKEFEFDGNFDPDRFTSAGAGGLGGGALGAGAAGLGGGGGKGGGRTGTGTLPNISVDDGDGFGGPAMAGVAGAGALAGAGLAGRGDRRSNGNIYANGGGNGQGNGYPNPSSYNNQGRNGGIEDEDDGMGGRLGGTAIGGGVVTPFVLGRPGPGPGPGGRQQSIPVGGYFPSSNMSEKQRLMLAQQQQQQNLQRHPQNLAANHPNLPNPYGTYGGAGGPGVYPSPPPTSVSPTTATFSNEGSGFNAYDGYPTSNDHSSSAGTSDGGRSNAMARNAAMSALGAGAAAGGGRGYEETESNYSTSVSGYGNSSSQGQPLSVGQVTEKQREAMASYTGGGSGGGRMVANPDEDAPQGSATQHPNASHVLVHHDGGRVPQAQNSGGDVDEIPPTYDSIGDETRRGPRTFHAIVGINSQPRSSVKSKFKVPELLIPKPPGSAGRNYNLQHAMGLSDKREAHLFIVKKVQTACCNEKRINEQDQLVLHELIASLSSIYAYIRAIFLAAVRERVAGRRYEYDSGGGDKNRPNLGDWVPGSSDDESGDESKDDDGDDGDEELDLIEQKYLRLVAIMTPVYEISLKEAQRYIGYRATNH